MPRDTRILLSVDFDFFVREKPIWDWSHAESAIYQELLWPQRAAGFLARGYDLRDETDPEKHANPTPSKFWDVLERLGYLDLGDQTACVTNSHAFAAPHWWSGYYEEDDYLLINFDAHHDLGYRTSHEQDKRWEKGVSECGDWLYMLMRQNPRMKAKIIYPEWKGLEELRHEKEIPWKRYGFLEGRVEAGVFSEDFVRLPEDAIVDDVFICRSGAWVPPWLDESFERFCYRGGFYELAALFEDEEGMCAMDPRPFPWEQVEKFAEDIRTAMSPQFKALQDSLHKQD